MARVKWSLPAAALAAVLLAACGGDGGSNGGPSSPTPYIPPPSHAPDEALAKLDEIIALVQAPPGPLVALAQAREGDVQLRSDRILRGENETSGLDDVRLALEANDRIGAGEYLHNVVTQYATAPLTDKDTNSIDPETLDEIDLSRSFDADHSDGMEVSSIFKQAVVKMIELWHRI